MPSPSISVTKPSLMVSLTGLSIIRWKAVTVSPGMIITVPLTLPSVAWLSTWPVPIWSQRPGVSV